MVVSFCINNIYRMRNFECVTRVSQFALHAEQLAILTWIIVVFDCIKFITSYLFIRYVHHHKKRWLRHGIAASPDNNRMYHAHADKIDQTMDWFLSWKDVISKLIWWCKITMILQSKSIMAAQLPAYDLFTQQKLLINVFWQFCWLKWMTRTGCAHVSYSMDRLANVKRPCWTTHCTCAYQFNFHFSGLHL